jgi:predicted HTH transcriptional regulator
LAVKIGITKRGVEKNIAKLKEKGLLIRIGSDKTGLKPGIGRWKTERKLIKKFGVKVTENSINKQKG